VQGALGVALPRGGHAEHGDDGAADLTLGAPAPAPEDVGGAFRVGRRRAAAGATQFDDHDGDELVLLFETHRRGLGAERGRIGGRALDREVAREDLVAQPARRITGRHAEFDTQTILELPVPTERGVTSPCDRVQPDESTVARFVQRLERDEALQRGDRATIVASTFEFVALFE
jgi:hypothetical protein